MISETRYCVMLTCQCGDHTNCINILFYTISAVETLTQFNWLDEKKAVSANLC